MNKSINVLVQLFAPVMIADECRVMGGHDTPVAEAAWPAIERDLLVEDTPTLRVQLTAKSGRK